MSETTKPEASTDKAAPVELVVMRYFRSQAIPSDPGTMMYWAEDEAGKAKDIHPNEIPQGAIVTDVTYDFDKRKVRRKGGTFVNA